MKPKQDEEIYEVKVGDSPWWQWLWSFPGGRSGIVVYVVCSSVWIFSLLPTKRDNCQQK